MMNLFIKIGSPPAPLRWSQMGCSGGPRPRTCSPHKLALALLAVLFCMIGGARAQNPTATASLSETSTEVGEAVELRIEVIGGHPNAEPAPPQLDGLSVGETKVEQSFNMTNFRSTESFSFTYTLLPRRAGTFKIPSQEIQVGSRILHTPALTLTVTAASNGGGGGAGGQTLDRPIFAEINIPKKTAYVGETIPAEIRLYIDAHIKLLQADQNPMLHGEGFAVQKFSAPRDSHQMLNGKEFRVITYKTALTAVTAGTLSIGPAETSPIVQVPARPPSFRNFQDDMFAPLTLYSQPQQVKVESELVKLEVQPLPTAGQPADFSGAIGHFELSAPEADPSKGVSAGDPVTVRLQLSGRGNFDRVMPPVLEDDKGLRTYPATGKFKADDEVGLNGTKTFEQVLIPQGARNSLPGYHLSYFDPVTGKYVTLETPPIAMKIAQGSAPPPATPGPSAGEAPAASPTPTPAVVQHPAEDILYIRTDAGPAARPGAFTPLYRQRAFWLAQLVPLASLSALILCLALRARAGNEAFQRREASLRYREGLLRTLRNKRASRRDFYSAAARLAETYSAPGDPETSAGIDDVLRRRDELAYGGEEALEQPVSSEERRGVLATVTSLVRRGEQRPVATRGSLAVSGKDAE